MLRNISLLLCPLVLAAGTCGAENFQQAAAPAPSAQQSSPSPAPQTPQASSSPAPPANPPSQRPHASSKAANSSANLPAAAWTLLAQGAASDKLRNRSDAISALTVLDRDRRAVSTIGAALDDKEESIRVLAATSLGDMKARAAIPKLKDALEDNSAQVSFAAAQALWKIGDRSGREILYEVLSGDRKVKPGIIQGKVNAAKHDLHDPKALALIGVNEASGAFLGPFSMGVSFIEEYAKNNGAPIQAVCAKLLASDDSRDTVNELRDALGDKNWAVRAAAARALAKMNHREVVPQLKDMMENDKEQPARFAAAAAIVRLSAAPEKVPAAASPPARPADAAEPAER
ncbi:MAG: HEAT repeat domain-containing protein [Candidatus Acidiferrales bacterium]|jgi:HEAT repeat protein